MFSLQKQVNISNLSFLYLFFCVFILYYFLFIPFFLYIFDNETRMKISISSKAFVALPTDRRTKYLQNRCSFMRGIWSDISIRGWINHFPPKRGWRTDRRTYRRTDICFYRVTLLLKTRDTGLGQCDINFSISSLF